MKISELLLDKFIASRLYEMAYSRDDAWRKCTGLVEPLTEHLLKVFIMPTSNYVPHWKDEIESYLNIMNDIELKPKNKRLTAATYHEWLIEQPGFNETKIDKRINQIKKRYQDEKIEVPDTIFEDYKRVMEQICVDLGNNEITEI